MPNLIGALPNSERTGRRRRVTRTQRRCRRLFEPIAAGIYRIRLLTECAAGPTCFLQQDGRAFHLIWSLRRAFSHGAPQFALTRPRPIEHINRNLPICTGFMPQDHVLSLYLLRVCAVHRPPDLQDSIASEALYVHSCKFKVFDSFDVVLPKRLYGSASLYEVPVVWQ